MFSQRRPHVGNNAFSGLDYGPASLAITERPAQSGGTFSDMSVKSGVLLWYTIGPHPQVPEAHSLPAVLLHFLRRYKGAGPARSETGMGFWKWLKHLFGAVDIPPHDYQDSNLLFYELDLDRVSKTLQLVDEGSSRGARNEPPSDLDTLDDVENRIVSTIQSEVKQNHEKATNYIRAYSQRLAALKINTHLAQLGSAADAACTDFKTRIQRDRDRIFSLHQEVVSINRDFERFQSDHLLSRLPHYPLSKLWHWGVIATIVLVEAGLNGMLLARGLMLGLLQGITYALVIAALNVGGGLVAGCFVLPYFKHRRRLFHFAAFWGFLFWILYAFGLNLLVAHYRSALGGSNPTEAEKTAIQTLIAGPLNIPEVTGWVLFLLGVAFSIIAAVDGWRMDDPYPGYGALARRKDEITREYRTEREQLINELEEIRNQALADLEVLAGEVESRRAQHKALQQSISKCVELFSGHIHYLEQCGNSLLSNYRGANRTARTSPAPAHFSAQWHLKNSPNLQGIDMPPDLDAALEQKMNDTLRELGSVRQRINDAFVEAVKEFKGLQELSAEHAHGV